MTRPIRVAIAMSGGVDSSTAAALLLEEGCDVFGLMLRLWSPTPDGYNRCCAPADVSLARSVADLLGFPFYVIDVRERFKEKVVEPFIRGYAQGQTPNPCISCNRDIRWQTLLNKALALGASYLATGHYARIDRQDGLYALRRGEDLSKDQSYVLSVLTQDQLARTRLPVGSLTKTEVRNRAKMWSLPVADKHDSQDLCFVPDGDYRGFLRAQGVPQLSEGPIVNMRGEAIGLHTGLSDYTIGQRKGIGIADKRPYYVLGKDLRENTLHVGTREECNRSRFRAGPMHWIAGAPPNLREEIAVQVRYRAPAIPAYISLLPDHTAEFMLSRPLPDITPGQHAVVYCADRCLGGGTILA